MDDIDFDFKLIEEFMQENFCFFTPQLKKDIKNVRAIYVPIINRVRINLGAEQWKLPENRIIEEISMSLLHEPIHLFVDMYASGKFTAGGEERVCQLMAGQKGIRHRRLQKRNI
jgi:hypothetical protein